MKIVDRAVMGQLVARPLTQMGDDGSIPISRLHFAPVEVVDVRPLLLAEHYLGPLKGGRYCFAGWLGDELVAAMIWRGPTSRHLPSDGSWLELSRWCLTPRAGKNAGSRMMGWVVRWLRRHVSYVTTLVSYSDPAQGHTGALYRASGWHWAPTWHRLRPPPTGNGSWNGKSQQHPKDRWIYVLTDDPRRASIIAIKDSGAERRLKALAESP